MTDQLRNPSSSSSTSSALTSRSTNADCAGGCGFFGSPQNDNLCSKCFSQKHKQIQLAQTTTTTSTSSATISITNESHSASALASTSDTDVGSALDLPSQSLAEPQLDSSPVLTELFPQQQIDVVSIPVVDVPVTGEHLSTPSKKLKNRCQFCTKKVGLTFFACKCDDQAMFCSSHRYPHSHKCSFDHQQQQKNKLIRNNPLVAHDKLERI